jgi:hypothetical protein
MKDLKEAQQHTQSLSTRLKEAQTAHARAEVENADALDAMDDISDRAESMRKRRGAGELQVRHRMVLAAHNRLRAREKKISRESSRLRMKLKVAREREEVLARRKEEEDRLFEATHGTFPKFLRACFEGVAGLNGKRE